LGQLRKDLCLKGFIDQPAHLIALKINGKVVSQYNQDVREILNKNPNIHLEVVDPNEQVASTGGKIIHRIQREDPNQLKKSKIQSEFAAHAKLRQTTFKLQQE